MIKFIDANCRVGRGPVQREGAIEDTAALLSLMDDFHVAKALAHHAVAVYADPLLGNELLIKETRGSDRFLPQWAVLPRIWELFPTGAEWLAQMKENGVSSVRMFPAQYGHSLKRYAAGELLDALGECRVPVFIALDQLKDWDALYELCTDYPAVRFVLCSPGYRCLRSLVPILENCGNLFVETSNFLGHNALRDFCKYHGAQRLIFGSGIPEASLAAAASQLCLSEISDEEKQLIAAGNIERLLSEVRL